MLEIMRKELVAAKALKAAVIAPHNKRIKALTSAIRNTEAFNTVTEELNATSHVAANTIPELIEPIAKGE